MVAEGGVGGKFQDGMLNAERGTMKDDETTGTRRRGEMEGDAETT